MGRTISIQTASRDLQHLPEELGRGSDAVAVTQDGAPVLAILNWDEHESMVETIEILADSDLIRKISAGLESAEKGDFVSWDDVKAGRGT